jgi:hypothetical protein
MQERLKVSNIMESMIVSLEGVEYLVHPNIQVPISGLEKATDFIPATVVAYNEGTFGDEQLRAVCEKFAEIDDVWDEIFLDSE